MRKYLVELYLSRLGSGGLAEAAARATEAAEEVTRGGAPVRFLRSIYVPEDETCFYLFEASSRESVAEAARLAGLPSLRIVEASLVPAVARGSESS
jgi:hypothetical protein